ncbi:MAG: hypothetical protein BWY89_00860 [Bacteroidetes bacterium ADurb.BinA012]|nr:MAG: hypothetical protein BWY89_00860 [Bacteroidetes bacterium ADurb.BinA012]
MSNRVISSGNIILVIFSSPPGAAMIIPLVCVTIQTLPSGLPVIRLILSLSSSIILFNPPVMFQVKSEPSFIPTHIVPFRSQKRALTLPRGRVSGNGI